MPTPVAYFITIRTYGTWLPGDPRGTISRTHNIPGTRPLAADASKFERARELLKTPPIVLSDAMRACVDETIREVIAHRSWHLGTVNVRTNHVHIILTGTHSPERMMNDFKSWSTRRLVEAGLIKEGTHPWERHGSTIYLWNNDQVREKIDYVTRFQDGENWRAAHPESEPRP